MSSELEQINYENFRECLSEVVIQRLSAPQKATRRRAAKGRKSSKSLEKGGSCAEAKATSMDDEIVTNDAGDLAEFIDVQHPKSLRQMIVDHHIQYLASEIFLALPPSLRTLDHNSFEKTPSLADMYADPIPASTVESIVSILPVSATESLASYLIPSNSVEEAPASAITPLITDLLTAYISVSTTAPPPPSSTRPATNACEICDRTQLPLTYHHLIPRAVHAKVLKRNWHPKEKLDSVAWLCRACHSFVHRCASNEELAKEYFTIEMLLERDDVRAFAAWVGRVRWKAR